MKINTSTESRKKLILSAAIALLIGVGGYTALAASNNIWPFADSSQSTDKPEPEVSDINDTEEAAKENPEATSRSTQSSDAEPTKQLTPGNTEDTNTKPVMPEISHATQSGDSVEVVATFSTTANGVCRLTLSKPGAENINRESPITIGSSYYICGFTVNNVSGSGWTATVTHAYSGKISDSASQKVEQ